ncbi:tRNA lysidine(34) synthetase TilS [Lutibacter sp. TH_r2]|uniref:tRNA lysidine(34) synthetase TilS n=1 Tax=Lutibacter sp. TH_r2 TaxID=3082083 RepID=UPI002953097B|nr:tRNA lysidine(34) synthetase TilS [Lutibacter sp. TH_r2]MDV7186955.1 tRNA lysidine(34) synthetase TilS [Lutibacter sp. TH_r2]
MIRAFKQHIKSDFPFLKSKKLLVAISGGIDSVVLTHLLYKSKFKIGLAHCNFNLRGKDSNKDEQFVKDFGEKLELETFTTNFNTKAYAETNNVSTQMAARDLRYNWFQKIIKKNKYDYIVTAHQKDDIIETFLINLTRGTGLDGLCGIPPINKNIVRPLLPFSRNEILTYATRNKIHWREDSSNSSIKYTRNKIRHKVVPVLKELNPSLLESFQNTLENLNQSKQLIKDRIKEVSQNVKTKHENEIHYNCEKLLALNNTKAYLYQLLKKYNFTEWNDVFDLLTAQTGKQISSLTHRLLKNREVLILTKIEDSKNSLEYKIERDTKKISEPIKLKFEVVHKVNDTKNSSFLFDEIIDKKNDFIAIDADKVQFPLIIRKRQNGDYFYPLGLNGKKKLSKFFKDEKLSIIEKENSWVLTSNNKIVWVIGKRLDDRFKVTAKTSTILKIKY